MTVAPAAVVLRERVAPVQFGGGVLFLAAVVLLARARAAEPVTTAGG